MEINKDVLLSLIPRRIRKDDKQFVEDHPEKFMTTPPELQSKAYIPPSSTEATKPDVVVPGAKKSNIDVNGTTSGFPSFKKWSELNPEYNVLFQQLNAMKPTKNINDEGRLKNAQKVNTIGQSLISLVDLMSLNSGGLAPKRNYSDPYLQQYNDMLTKYNEDTKDYNKLKFALDSRLLTDYNDAKLADQKARNDAKKADENYQRDLSKIKYRADLSENAAEKKAEIEKTKKSPDFQVVNPETNQRYPVDWATASYIVSQVKDLKGNNLDINAMMQSAGGKVAVQNILSGNWTKFLQPNPNNPNELVFKDSINGPGNSTDFTRYKVDDRTKLMTTYDNILNAPDIDDSMKADLLFPFIKANPSYHGELTDEEAKQLALEIVNKNK